MIAICPNPYRDSGCELSQKIDALLKGEGYETCLCPIFADEGDEILPRHLSYRKLEDVAGVCSLIIVVGGDGTILSAARQIHDYTVPLLGINLGTKGFMTILEPEDYACVLQAARGEYTLSKRMKLDVSLLRGGELVCRDKALNDVVLHGYGDCIQITARCNGNRITSFSGDGVILSTPTGSTAYSLAAGGPILMPDSASLVVTPMNPHALGVRPMVVSDAVKLTVTSRRSVVGADESLGVYADGENVAMLKAGESVEIAKSARSAKFVELPGFDPYVVLNRKLGWSR